MFTAPGQADNLDKPGPFFLSLLFPIMPPVLRIFFCLVQIFVSDLCQVWQTFGQYRHRNLQRLLTGSFALSELPIAWRLGSIRQAIPSEYPPSITTLNVPRIRRGMVVAYVQPVDWPFSATLRRAAGQVTTSYKVWRSSRFRFQKKHGYR